MTTIVVSRSESSFDALPAALPDRFHDRIVDCPGVDTIAEQARERVGHEMRRLLAAPDPAPDRQRVIVLHERLVDAGGLQVVDLHGDTRPGTDLDGLVHVLQFAGGDALLGEQVGHEFAASQQYIAIAVWFDQQALPQLASRFYAQALEERNHAMMIVQYLLDADAKVTIPGVEAPRVDFGSYLEPVQLALEQERENQRDNGEHDHGVARLVGADTPQQSEICAERDHRPEY